MLKLRKLVNKGSGTYSQVNCCLDYIKNRYTELNIQTHLTVTHLDNGKAGSSFRSFNNPNAMYLYINCKSELEWSDVYRPKPKNGEPWFYHCERSESLSSEDYYFPKLDNVDQVFYHDGVPIAWVLGSCIYIPHHMIPVALVDSILDYVIDKEGWAKRERERQLAVFMNSYVQQRVDSFEEEVKETEKAIESYKISLYEHRRRLEYISIERDALSKHRANLVDSLDKDLEIIRAYPVVDKVWLDVRKGVPTVFCRTKSIKAYGRDHPIRIYPLTVAVTLKGEYYYCDAEKVYEGYNPQVPAPHVIYRKKDSFVYWKACLGNIEGDLQELLQARKVGDALDLLIAFTQSYNKGDSAGAYYKQWDRWPEGVKEGEI